MEEIIKINNKTLSVIKLLGKGKGGYSFLVSDGKDNYVLKQIHHEPCDYYQFKNKLESELNDYKKLVEIGIRMPKLIDVDFINERILKEYIDGNNIFEMVMKDINIDNYLTQMRKMCELLYSKNINIDYFPTNFVINNELMYYVDYECNNYMDEWNFENWGIKYWLKTLEFMEYVNKDK